ncbi:D-alanyl-lipoteichoic acid biosynthesis protein DltD, partial [Clostridium frigoriphilum]
GFEVADFSKYEDENYFLMDSAHIGWKGWVYVNEAIDKYYNKNKN